jgi:prepilin peptidase CpaA
LETTKTTILLLGIALFIAAAYRDVKTFRIPNLLVAVIAWLAVTRLIVIGDWSLALYTIGASVVVLIVGFLLFWQGIVGGGDAKLITAAALLVGYHDLISFLLVMGICGALVSLAVVVTHWADKSKSKAKLTVPYGVAIATAGGITLFFQSPLLSSFLG